MSSRIVKRDNHFALARFHMLFICDRETMDKKLDRNRYASAQAISDYVEQRGGRFIWTGPNWPKWDPNRSAFDNITDIYPRVHTFDLALLYDVQDILGIDALPIMKVISVNEMYNPKEITKHMRANPNYYILHHTNEKRDIKAVTTTPYYHSFHCADPKIYHPGDGKKKYDFALLGKITQVVYPLRHKLKSVMEMLEKNGYKCYNHKHPGYDVSKPDKETRRFADTIRATRIVLTCSSKYSYRLSKYAEIPLCGTALAADLPKDGKSFFRKFVIEIKPTDSVGHIYHKLTNALPNWKIYADRGLESTLQNSLQTHYAKRFFDIYENHLERPWCSLKDGGIIDLSSVEPSNHCWWFPDREVKIPYQRKGVLTKNIAPREGNYSLASIALEYTLLHWLADRQYAPPVGSVIKFNTMEGDIVYGYEVKDATKLPKGPIKDEEHAIEILKEVPIKASRGCLTDFSLNLINGYFVDGRRSSDDMYRWLDPNTLWCIPEINTIQRKILLVVDVKGWAWDYKAQSIRNNFRGACNIDICYQFGDNEPKYTTDLLKDYDHVHFFGWNHIDSVARGMQDHGLIDVSTTIASSENELQLDKCRECIRNVSIVAVSPYLTKRSLELFKKHSKVFPCFNGVETNIFIPRSVEPKRKGPIRVLLCNKPPAKAYDCHGLEIAQKIQKLCDNDYLKVTLHISKYNTSNKLDRESMIKLYQDHDVFVHTGRHHLGTPNMAFEAASCGLAIVSTANGCLPLLFEGTKDKMGTLVEIPQYFPKPGAHHTVIAKAHKKDDDTAQAIATILTKMTRKQADVMGAAARRAVVENWTWSQRAQDYEKVFEL
jgi:glycosyltransferase involved in cell wall biosynthesis